MTPASGRPRYHHGNLREALLTAATAILDEGDAAKLSLRSIAARAGVSHAAPAHHFGTLQGLLTALAAHGMRRFVDAVETGHKNGKANAAYIAFARDNPGLFGLMFDKSRLNEADRDLNEAGARAFEMLGKLAAPHLPPNATPQDVHAMQLRIWARVHGYATLLLAGHLEKFPIGDDQLGLLDDVMGDERG